MTTPTTPRRLDIAYPDNQLTQRYLAARAIQGKQLEFMLSDGAAIKGFVTGIDDDNLQVCAGDDMKATLLSTRHVMQVNETGETIDSMPSWMHEDLKRFTRIFRRVSENELSRSSDDD